MMMMMMTMMMMTMIMMTMTAGAHDSEPDGWTLLILLLSSLGIENFQSMIIINFAMVVMIMMTMMIMMIMMIIMIIMAMMTMMIMIMIMMIIMVIIMIMIFQPCRSFLFPRIARQWRQLRQLSGENDLYWYKKALRWEWSKVFFTEKKVLCFPRTLVLPQPPSFTF